MNTGEAENTRTNLFGRWRHQSYERRDYESVDEKRLS